MAITRPNENTCQLCGHRPLTEFVVPNKTVLWLCEKCELYQYGHLVDDSAYASEYHHGYERHRDQKLRTAMVRLNRIAPQVHSKAPRLLDVGCSVGCTVEAANKRGWHGVGVDLSKDAVARCNRNGLECYVTDGVKLPFDDQSFDVLTSWHVIEHVANVEETLTEWQRVLRPGGVMALETPDATSPKVRRLGSKYRKFWAAEHTYTFSPQNLGEFVERAGFELLSRPVVGRLADLPATSTCYALVYQAYHGLRRIAGVHKAFQIFARRRVESGISRAVTSAA